MSASVTAVLHSGARARNDLSGKRERERERERGKVYSPQYNNTAVETVSNNTKWRAVRKAQGPRQELVSEGWRQ